MSAEGVWILFLLLVILYSCTDRHVTWEYDGQKHELYLNKDRRL